VAAAHRRAAVLLAAAAVAAAAAAAGLPAAAAGGRQREHGEAVVRGAPQRLQHPRHALDGAKPLDIRRHDRIDGDGVQPVGRLVPQHVHRADALQLRLVHAVVVDVVRHPVGHDDRQHDAEEELDACARIWW